MAKILTSIFRYGHADALYCRLLTKRLQLHQKYTIIPGNLTLNDHQIGTLTSDINNSFELAIDLLDQLDELITFKTAGWLFGSILRCDKNHQKFFITL
jgi:hypothetical protein